MPIYEYYCPDTHTIYQFWARSSRYRDRLPRCPAGDGLKMQRRISAFSLTGIHKKSRKEEAPGDASGEDLDDPRMEAAMAELEREMEGMDEENPDPRRLAHLMRRMSDLTGEKLPAEMQEMISRLEKGEDPEKLEEEYGDLLGDEGSSGFGGDEFGDPSDGTPVTDNQDATSKDSRNSTEQRPSALSLEIRRILQNRRNQPRRDPNLYDLEDYIATTPSP